MAEYITKASTDGDASFHTGAPRHGSFEDFVGNKISADTKNSDADLNIAASSENLSSKYKYPQVSQAPEQKP